MRCVLQEHKQLLATAAEATAAASSEGGADLGSSPTLCPKPCGARAQGPVLRSHVTED